MVLTGFLGSGKTTILRNLLHSTQLNRTAVIINEFGEIGLDHDLVEASNEDYIQLTTGCICCKIRSDLLVTLYDLVLRRTKDDIVPFDQVIIETSGLADPIPIIQAILTDDKILSDFKLQSVVTTFDALSGIDTLHSYEQPARQIACADHIIITKNDLLDEEPPDMLASITSINPRAVIHRATLGIMAPTDLFKGSYANATGAEYFLEWLMTDDGSSVNHHVHRHDDEITSFSLVRESPLHAITLSLFLEALVSNYGEHLLRIKGLINIKEEPGKPAVVQGMQHVLYPITWLENWPSEDHTTRMVIIGKHISRNMSINLLELIEEEVTDEISRISSDADRGRILR